MSQKACRFAGVVFDLDGTLIHSSPDIAAALNIVLVEEGLAPFTIPEAGRFIGTGAERLIGDSFAARGRPLDVAQVHALTARYVATYERRGSPDTALYPGAAEMIGTLRRHDIPMAICTNKPTAITHQVLAQFQLEACFVAVIGGDGRFGLKPAAEPLLEACRLIGVAPARVLMVGDSGTDARTAQAAGCPVAILRHGYSREPVDSLGAAFVLDSIAEVGALVLG